MATLFRDSLARRVEYANRTPIKNRCYWCYARYASDQLIDFIKYFLRNTYQKRSVHHVLRVKSVLRLRRPKPLAAISYWSPHAEEGPLLSDYQKGLRGLPFVGT